MLVSLNHISSRKDSLSFYLHKFGVISLSEVVEIIVCLLNYT